MRITQAKQLVNEKFKYQKDGAFDVWTILDTNREIIRGDCEDYSLTFIWLAEDQNMFKFLLSLIIMQYVIWHVKTPWGEGHVVLYVRSCGQFIDNIKQDFQSREAYNQMGFKFIFPMLFPAVFLKLAVANILNKSTN